MNYPVEYYEPGACGGRASGRLHGGGPSVGDDWMGDRYILRDIHGMTSSCMHRALIDSPQRRAVEAFISTVYNRIHHAQLSVFMPELFAVREAAAEHITPNIVAAIGLQRIGAAPVFLEQYLDGSVDESIGKIIGRLPRRSAIAEVGNLATISAGVSRHLIAFLVHHFAATGIDWAVCTGTNAVRATLKRMGVGFDVIAKADAERLGDQQVHWGSYYRNNPWVLVVDIKQAVSHLAPRYHYLAMPS